MAMTTVIRRFLHPPIAPSGATSTHLPSQTPIRRLYGLSRNGLSRTITVCCFVLTVAACSSPEERMFMQACTYGGTAGNDDACECAYDKMTDRYPKETFQNLTSPSQLPPDFVDFMMQAGMECRSEL